MFKTIPNQLPETLVLNFVVNASYKTLPERIPFVIADQNPLFKILQNTFG
jgi:hypothetical protein